MLVAACVMPLVGASMVVGVCCVFDMFVRQVVGERATHSHCCCLLTSHSTCFKYLESCCPSVQGCQPCLSLCQPFKWPGCQGQRHYTCGGGVCRVVRGGMICAPCYDCVGKNTTSAGCWVLRQRMCRVLFAGSMGAAPPASMRPQQPHLLLLHHPPADGQG